MDEDEPSGTKVLPFSRRGATVSKRIPQFEGFPKFAKAFGHGTAATVTPLPVARLMQDIERLPD